MSMIIMITGIVERGVVRKYSFAKIYVYCVSVVDIEKELVELRIEDSLK